MPIGMIAMIGENLCCQLINMGLGLLQTNYIGVCLIKPIQKPFFYYSSDAIHMPTDFFRLQATGFGP